MTAPPPLPPGRELDAAVAVVLGCGEHQYHDPVPAYSTDHAAIPELLAWLQQWAGEITLHGEISEEGPDPAKGSFPWAASCVRGDVVETRPLYFDTLPEALCNLVLAVAARRTP